jgi:xanthine dehydrogenase small subunit
VGTRAAQAIAKVTIAGIRGDTTRVAYGSVAPTVVRVPRTEAELSNGGSVDKACELLRDEISPIDDLRSTADYRRRVAENLLRQFLAETRRARTAR